MQAESAPLQAAQQRRLHPLSWLFLALAQLRQFAVPLIALLVFGRGGSGQWWESLGALGAVVVAGYAVLQYFTYRFQISDGELTIRSGVLHRNVRHIPLARIQNVVQRRNLLHRLAGVAEVRLESAAGQASAEAEMRVLSLADARALEELVRVSRAGGQAIDAPAEDEPEPLLQLPLPELVRLGLSSNRGMVVVAAAFGVMAQLGQDGFGRNSRAVVGRAWDFIRDLMPDGSTNWWLAAVLLLLAASILLRLLSVLLAILKLHDFRLTEDGQRLSVEGGLLTRLRGHAARDRIQRWMLQENVWQRWMHRQRLRVETAAVRRANEDEGLSELLPIAPRETVDALLQRWLPALDWPRLQWQPLHPRAWRRYFMVPAWLTLLLAAGLSWRFGSAGLLALLLLPLWLWRARMLGNWNAWCVDDRYVAWRSGWSERSWQIVEIDRIQLLRVEQSPFDRRHGMASLLLDTAGADPMQPALRLQYLPAGQVHELAARITRSIA